MYFLAEFLEFVVSHYACRQQSGLAAGLEFVARPEPLLIKDIKVKVNKQKPSKACLVQIAAIVLAVVFVKLVHHYF